MTTGRDTGLREALDPGRWLTRLAAVGATESDDALGEIAERVHELVPVDLVAVRLIDETGGEEATHGYCLGPSDAAQRLAPLLAPDGPDPIALADAAIAAGEPVTWPRLLAEPEQITRLTELADAGRPAGALHRLLADAGGLAVPIGVPGRPIVGAITLVGLGRDAPVARSAVEDLLAVTPQIALTALNHRLAARSRRNRETLEGVIASSRMGMVVTDARGRISLTNRAADEIVGIPLGPFVNRPIGSVIGESVKWRFTNPEDYADRVLAVHERPEGEAVIDAETVDGRAVEHSSTPVRDPAGRIVGRIDILTDVTAARGALAEARRLAAERAALLEREERRALEEVTLSRAAHRMASAVSAAQIHEALIDLAHELVPGCEKSAVLAIDGRELVRPVATRGFADETADKMVFRPGEGTVGRMMVDRRAFICNDTAVDDRLSARITGPEGIRSYMLIPLVHGERVLGLVSLNCLSPREFGERDVRLVTELAGHAAGALTKALRFEQERHIAEILQQALIADELPAIPGLELAALYQPAAGSLVGGDFYSAWRLCDGRLALLVGDVSGKGVEAAGVTAMVRYMAEALSQHTSHPAELVTELNDLLCPRLADGALVTLVLAVVDTAAGTLRWCSAGHPPAVLMGPGGRYRTLEDPGPPCGAFAGQGYHESEEPFEPGDVLVLCTDGLLEARRQGREFGEGGLRDALVGAGGEAPDGLARAVHTRALDWCGGRLTDDVAIAVVRRTS